MAGRPPNPPTTRDRQVGNRLERMRDEAGLSLRELSDGTGLSRSTLSRIESGQRAIKAEEIAVITMKLGRSIEEMNELVGFLQSDDTGGWWERPLPGVPPEMGLLAKYAADADSLTDWSVMLVPGLLQTESYAYAFMLADGTSKEDADLRWVARKRRQEILGTVDYSAFIYEGALRVPYGGKDAHAEQINHLLRATQRGVAVRVVRQRPPAGGLSHSWLYMTFPNVSPVVNVEVYGGGVYLQNDQVEPYTRRLRMLNDLAVSGTETRAMLRALLKEIRQ